MAGAAVVGRPVIPRLINRLQPAPLESLGSLLERLREANHYRERRWLGGLLARHPERPEVVRRVRDFEVLAALTGLGRATLVSLTLHRFAPWYGVDRAWGGRCRWGWTTCRGRCGRTSGGTGTRGRGRQCARRAGGSGR